MCSIGPGVRLESTSQELQRGMLTDLFFAPQELGDWIFPTLKLPYMVTSFSSPCDILHLQPSPCFHIMNLYVPKKTPDLIGEGFSKRILSKHAYLAKSFLCLLS